MRLLFDVTNPHAIHAWIDAPNPVRIRPSGTRDGAQVYRVETKDGRDWITKIKHAKLHDACQLAKLFM